MILGRFSGARASSVSPITDETAAVTADSRPTNFEAASAAVVVPTKSPADGSSLTNRGFESAAPEVDADPGRLRLDNEPPRLLWPNKPWAWQESDNTNKTKNATMSVMRLRPDATRKSFAVVNAGFIGVSIRSRFRNVQAIEPLLSCSFHPLIAHSKSRRNRTSLLIRLPVRGIVTIQAIVGRSAENRLSLASSLTDLSREVGTSAIWAGCEFCGKFSQNSITWRLPS
jgi:hypothetical protein